MRDYKFTTISADQFDKFASRHSLGSMFQDSRWAKVKSDNWQAKFVALKINNKIVIASLILIRSLPFGFTMWYLPRGPLFDPKKTEDLAEFTTYLKQLARSHRAILIKSDPNLLVSSSSFEKARQGVDKPRQSDYVGKLKQAGWRHLGYTQAMSDTIQPRYNAVFYIENDWEKKISKKTRKFINRGESMGIEVKEVGLDRIDDFATIIDLTAKAKQISLRDRDYFTKIKQAFGDDCLLAIANFDPQLYQQRAEANLKEIQAKIVSTSPESRTILTQLTSQEAGAKRTKAEADELAKQYKKIIPINASLSVLSHNQLEMLYSGLDRRFDRFYAPHIADKWRIAWAEKRGGKRANFGGIEGTLDDSLSKFKAVFGSNVDEFIGEFNLYTYPVLSWIFDRLVPKAKSILKHLRRLTK